MRRLSLWVLALAAGAVIVAALRPRPEPAAGPTGAPGELDTLLDWAAVYERDGDIYLSASANPRPIRLAGPGTFPRWSPDGASVAFVRGNRIMRVDIADGAETVVAVAGKPRAVAWCRHTNEILFTDHRAVRAAPAHGGPARTVVDGYDFRELDISADGRRLIATVRGPPGTGYYERAFDLAAGQSWKFTRGCSAGFSPDGAWVLNNLDGHRQVALRAWPDGKEVRRIDAPPGLKFDNQFWSNHPDWLVSQSEGDRSDIFAHQVSANRAYPLTFTGDCGRPDLFVRTAP